MGGGDELEVACSTGGRDEMYTQNIIRKTVREHSIWENNISTNFKTQHLRVRIGFMYTIKLHVVINTVTFFRGCRWGFGLDIGFIDHLCTRLVSTSNYSITAKFHNSQIVTAPDEPFQAACVFTSRSLATASNSVDSSASRPSVLSSQTPVQSWLSSKSKSKLLYDWRFTANQFVLAPSPLRVKTDFFFSWTLSVIVLIWQTLRREDGFVSCEYAWPFVKYTYSMSLKILAFALYTSPLWVQVLQSR
jgi:hypothetical protein